MGRLPWRCLREVEMHGITPIRTDQVTTVLVLELVTGTGTAADVQLLRYMYVMSTVDSG
jgi:hypothetical protein